jgi:L,D-peptidoglycan transpeptidase YkuD (ErfK/YbiS/YcfS/YnhG family)
MMSQVPVQSRQVVVVAGSDPSSTTNLITLWERKSPQDPWIQVGVPLPGRNGESGWSESHHEGDLSSPVGVFTLTAAGGRLPDPGTGLPYEYQPSFYRAGDPGTALAEAFDYVLAIDYNRMSGHPPSDPNRPLGAQAGGDIWMHVDHASPTHGCVAVSREAIEAILAWLTPAAHPVMVMGDQAALSA